MECPFCAEMIKHEAVVCKHCSRDLRVVRPILLEIESLNVELVKLRRDLVRANLQLERNQNPFRYFAIRFAVYIVVPLVLLLTAHILVTIVFDLSPLPLRLASIAIPLLFGFIAFPLHRVSLLTALVLGLSASVITILAMLTATGIHDHIPVLPQGWVEWREVIEFGTSILLAFISGNILSNLVLSILPRIFAGSGKPNAFALRMARLLGGHVGEEQLRRRARMIQHLTQSAGPLVGVAVTSIGSLYTGLKGVLG